MNEPNFVYKLLDNGRGVILTRNPQAVKDKLFLRFEGAPQGALAVFQFDNGRESYQELKEGECSLKISTSKGEVKVSVITLDNNTTPKRWVCEQLKYHTAPCGDIFVCPNDMNLPQAVTELKLENEELRAENIKLHQRLDELDARLQNIMEGYDLV